MNKKIKLKMPTKVKIDVDGNENEVFKGEKNVILISKEIYYENSGLKKSKLIISKIKNSNFKIMKEEVPSKTNLGSDILF